ncbi:threonine--tRNA ligase, partial [bacterium]|nr:threonine--tRNA ligase [bacterium]
GKFPTWLAPVQVKLLSVSDEVHGYCESVKAALMASDVRVEIDSSNEKIGYKIRQALNERVPYLAIVGKREAEAGTLSVRGRQGELGALTAAQLIEHVRSESVTS